MAIADRRLELDAILRNIIGSGNVYFQPPESVKMHYPAIRYQRNRIENTSADNITYKQDVSYMIICIYRDPDDELPVKISQLPRCIQIRPQYTVDGLIHDTFELYF